MIIKTKKSCGTARKLATVSGNVKALRRGHKPQSMSYRFHNDFNVYCSSDCLIKLKLGVPKFAWPLGSKIHFYCCCCKRVSYIDAASTTCPVSNCGQWCGFYVSKNFKV